MGVNIGIMSLSFGCIIPLHFLCWLSSVVDICLSWKTCWGRDVLFLVCVVRRLKRQFHEDLEDTEDTRTVKGKHGCL